MNVIDRTILEKIQAHALEVDWHRAFGGKASGNRHLFRVVAIATFLAKKERANAEICEAGAWLHDLGLVNGNDDNPLAVRQVAEAYLTSLGLDGLTKKRIAECAETHEGEKEALSLEARIVHDADVLDKTGLLGVIRHTWKIVNLVDPQASASEVCFLVQRHLQKRKERLYTETARKLVRIPDAARVLFFAQQEEALEHISTIMQDARSGMISDEIARNLLLKTDNQCLMHQLTISEAILQWWYEQGGD